MDTHLWLAAAFVLVVPTYLPNLLLNYSLRYLQPTVSSTYTYIQPVLAVALSVAMGLDKLHIDTMLFALVLFAGVWMVLSSYKK
jgi:drug/metabolite transporter (DMT)-like permease